MHFQPDIFLKILLIIAILFVLRVILTAISSALKRRADEKEQQRIESTQIDYLEGFADDSTLSQELPQKSTTAPNTDKKAEKPFGSIINIIDATIVAIILVFFVIEPFVVRVYRIESVSMQPTLKSAYAVVASPIPIKLHKFDRGDIITFRPSEAMQMIEWGDDYEQEADDTSYIKRVIGVPGDRIRIIRNGGLFLNGKLQEEKYIYSPAMYNFPPSVSDLYRFYRYAPAENIAGAYVEALAPYINEDDEYVVPESHYFVLGDNRNRSLDSHIFGAVDEQLIESKMLFIAWPIQY